MNDAPSLETLQGAILGAVVGDAFGSVLEGMVPERARDAVASRATKKTPWGYTDDGAMTLAVLDCLLEFGQASGPELLEALCGRFDPVRGFGKGLRRTLEAFERGQPWETCAFTTWPEGSQGNGAAVRVAPLACLPWESVEAFQDAVRASVRVTHAHPEAIDAALVQAHAVALTMASPELPSDRVAFLAALKALLPPVCSAMEAQLARLPKLWESDATEVEAARTLGTSTLAVESVPAALWAFLNAPKNYEKCVTDAARLGGDIDSICCLVGALAGAAHGVEAIPALWRENLQDEETSPDSILTLCEWLWKKFQSSDTIDWN